MNQLPTTMFAAPATLSRLHGLATLAGGDGSTLELFISAESNLIDGKIIISGIDLSVLRGNGN